MARKIIIINYYQNFSTLFEVAVIPNWNGPSQIRVKQHKSSEFVL